jgi:hypothetical protein
MIKISAIPIGCVVANRTIMRVAILHVIFGTVVSRLVARPAIRGRPRVHSADMTGCAIRLNVRSRQRKRSIIVIEVGIPIGCVVANRAIVREIILYVAFRALIILLMARPAIRGRPRVHSADMTCRAIRLNMRTR